MCLKRLEHGLLRDVFGIRHVAQDGECRGIDAPFVWTNQLIEKLVLAVPNAPDQLSSLNCSRWICPAKSLSSGITPHRTLSSHSRTPTTPDGYSGSFFHPVNIETKLFQPCSTTITKCPKTNASIAHMIRKCHSRA